MKAFDIKNFPNIENITEENRVFVEVIDIEATSQALSCSCPYHDLLNSIAEILVMEVGKSLLLYVGENNSNLPTAYKFISATVKDIENIDGEIIVETTGTVFHLIPAQNKQEEIIYA
jgi:hypothetical protein